MRKYLFGIVAAFCITVFATPTFADINDDLITEAYKGNNARVVQLLADGADVNAKDSNGDTALIKAAAYHQNEAVKTLLTNGADIHVQGNWGWTALIAAAANGSNATVKTLLTAGADVNAKADNDWTALMDASYYGYPDIVKTLLAKGADVNAQNSNGKTALDVARERWQTETVQVLENYIQEPAVVKAIKNADKGLESLTADLSVWRDKEGNFNKARLASDGVGAVVLGTTSALITGHVMKKKQVENGMDSIRCVVGGQVVADWGDDFVIRAEH